MCPTSCPATSVLDCPFWNRVLCAHRRGACIPCHTLLDCTISLTGSIHISLTTMQGSVAAACVCSCTAQRSHVRRHFDQMAAFQTPQNRLQNQLRSGLCSGSSSSSSQVHWHHHHRSICSHVAAQQSSDATSAGLEVPQSWAGKEPAASGNTLLEVHSHEIQSRCLMQESVLHCTQRLSTCHCRHA